MLLRTVLRIMLKSPLLFSIGVLVSLLSWTGIAAASEDNLGLSFELPPVTAVQQTPVTLEDSILEGSKQITQPADKATEAPAPKPTKAAPSVTEPTMIGPTLIALERYQEELPPIAEKPVVIVPNDLAPAAHKEAANSTAIGRDPAQIAEEVSGNTPISSGDLDASLEKPALETANPALQNNIDSIGVSFAATALVLPQPKETQQAGLFFGQAEDLETAIQAASATYDDGFGLLGKDPEQAEALAENVPSEETLAYGDIGLDDWIFDGGSSSLVAHTVGSAEGTRHWSGKRTQAYYGHEDPGNGVWNLGTFSYQHVAKTPEEADEKQLKRLKRQGIELEQQASQLGITLTLEEKLNGLDLANQAPLAALGKGGYIERLDQAYRMSMEGAEAIAWARTRSYIDPDTKGWNAPGLGNNLYSISQDQERRMAAINKALGAYDRNTSTRIALAQLDKIHVAGLDTKANTWRTDNAVTPSGQISERNSFLETEAPSAVKAPAIEGIDFVLPPKQAAAIHPVTPDSPTLDSPDSVETTADVTTHAATTHAATTHTALVEALTAQPTIGEAANLSSASDQDTDKQDAYTLDFATTASLITHEGAASVADAPSMPNEAIPDEDAATVTHHVLASQPASDLTESDFTEVEAEPSGRSTENLVTRETISTLQPISTPRVSIKKPELTETPSADTVTNAPKRPTLQRLLATLPKAQNTEETSPEKSTALQPPANQQKHSTEMK
ncbi:MAG: hypothetical protein AAF050_07815 [Cyanobacteria bacterium J06649_5]